MSCNLIRQNKNHQKKWKGNNKIETLRHRLMSCFKKAAVASQALNPEKLML